MKYTHADVYPVHYFQTFRRIEKVTCEKCLKILEQKERK